MRTRRTRAEQWEHVESEAVDAVRYFPDKAMLDVRYVEGREYRYHNVPRSKYRALRAADSIGGFVNKKIKPHHDCEEITSEFSR